MGLQEVYRYLEIAKRRKWELLGVASIVFVLITLQVFFTKHKDAIYVANIKLLVKPPIAMTTDEAETSLSSWFTSIDMMSDLYLSETVLERVHDRLDAKMNWKGLRKRIRFVSEDMSRTSKRKKVWESFVLYLEVTGKDAEWSKELAEATLTECVAYTKDVASEEITRERRNLEMLAIEAKDKVIELQRKVVEWRKLNGTWDGIQIIEAHGERMLKMDKEIADKEIEVNIARSRLRQIQGLEPGNAAIESFVGPTADLTAMQEFQRALNSENSRLEELLRTYTSENYQVQIQREKVQQARASFYAEYERVFAGVLVTAQAEIDTLLSTLHHLKVEKERLSSNEDLVDNQVELTRLNDELKQWQQNLEELQPRIHEATLLEEKRRSINVFTILSDVEVRVKGGAGMQQILGALVPGIFLAFFVGFVVVFVRELLAEDLKFRNRVELLELDVLVELPVLDSKVSDAWAIATGNIERVRDNENLRDGDVQADEDQ